MTRKGDLEWLAAELSAIRRQLLPANESPEAATYVLKTMERGSR